MTMQRALKHFFEFSTYTEPGLYKKALANELPDDIRTLGKLIRSQIIHQVTLKNYQFASKEELAQGTKTKLPWYRQPEDAVLPTTASMLTELYRRDPRGLVEDRAVKDKLILTCRPVSILMAAILKSKGIPSRVRSGFASYLPGYKARYVDHWVNQYWDKSREIWITIDIDGSDVIKGFDPYNIPEDKFYFSAVAWLDAREGTIRPEDFWNAKGDSGLMYIAWELLYDFHCLMNNEIIYPHHPEIVSPEVFLKLTDLELSEIDNLAKILKDPDSHFEALMDIWESNKRFRLLRGTLLYYG